MLLNISDTRKDLQFPLKMNTLQFSKMQLLEVNYSELLTCKYSDSIAKFNTSIHLHFAKKQIFSRNRSKSSLIINYVCLPPNLKYNKPEQSLVLLLFFNDESGFFYFKVTVQWVFFLYDSAFCTYPLALWLHLVFFHILKNIFSTYPDFILYYLFHTL